MATDYGHDSRCKHRRSSSPEDADRSSKRHRHHHGHGSRRRDEDSECDGETVPVVPSATPASNSFPNRHVPVDDDIEEGEIIEEDDCDVWKQRKESDAEPGDVEVIGDRDVGSDTAILRFFTRETVLHAKNSKTSPAFDGTDGTCLQSHVDEGIDEDDGSPNYSSADSQDGKYARARIDGMSNGHLDSKSPKGDKRHRGELGCFKGYEKLKGDYDGKDVEVNRGKVDYHRNSSSESGEEKYRMSGRSPSHVRYRSQSRSNGYIRDRSRSRSIVEEYACSQRRLSDELGGLSFAGRPKSDYDVDDERMVARRWEHSHGSRDLVMDERMEHRASRHIREPWDRDRSKERHADRALPREKERERGKNREVDWVCTREKDCERSHERHGRDIEYDKSGEKEDNRDRRREKERDRSWETVLERDRRREMERDKSRDRKRGSERDRDWESERDDKTWLRAKIKRRGRVGERERRDDRNRHKHRDTVNGKDKYLHHEDGYDSCDKYKMHSRHEDIEYHRERKRNSDAVKAYSTIGSTLVDDKNKLGRGEDEQDYLNEKFALQLPDQEEEDLNRVKEESRRRRESILEKYKKQQQQEVKQTAENEEKDKQVVDIPHVIHEAFDGKSNGVDDGETSFSVGKSPPENGNVASDKISVSRGLGEGTPKSERSDDKFCDDIFGETPTGVRNMGKGDGIQIERGGLHDNWDDAEGYYSYRFGEILDGRYEVTAAHGRGVFSTVVRAKNLKAGNGEPEDVAIKIIRNNDTMYKAGMNELVILKKLVGADPDDKHHCVRFLSSFKLTAVRAYAKQQLIALKHLRNCGVLHCDIKPDNMLVNEAKNVLKLCDFGNAMFAGKNEVTPYLVSRFYRAPEIILGLPYDHPLDMWSVGCCLFELYTGKVLFPGSTNNNMLRLHMELKGPFPKKMLRKGAFIEQHFDQDLNFLATEEDPVTRKTIKRMIVNLKPKDFGTIITGSPGEDPKILANFKDLLEKVFVLDPDKRLTVSQALNHPFITGK
ncbi:uncharacterized protein LOC133317248 isoform X2 [Gastrolobium bilobum]|uniref:uncharacterized protein LOC133317248 isoform X2 n=1 Tax=Gastrolobium bilobum TaxID=150636 RepID=UPI002AB09C74|nr:uncharacterized protein LOC133317248 isoform X2 [Gastrolobium bilobum]